MGIQELNQQIQSEKAAVEAAQRAIAEVQVHAKAQAESYKQSVAGYFSLLLSQNSDRARTMADAPFLRSDWPEDLWERWTPQIMAPPPVVIGGELTDPRGGDFHMPFPVPFIGQAHTVIVPSSRSDANAAQELLHALILRTAVMLPHQARFRFIDGATQGRAFPMVKKMPEPMAPTITTDIGIHLDEVCRSIDFIIRNYIDKQTPSFEKLKRDVRLNERFELIFIAGYPEGFDRRAIETLRQISRNGPVAGKYLFIHWNRDLPGPYDVNLDDYVNPYILPPGKSSYRNYALKASQSPSSTLETTILEKLADSKPPVRHLDWNKMVRPRDEEIWIGSSQRLIETPVGAVGTSQPLKLWFGADNEGQQCAHGMLGAMSGAGKSNLYHVLILGLASRYSPQELRMYLIDGKFGVEFQPYRDLPHAEVVSLHTSSELSRSVLTELLEEMERRNSLFAEAHVADINEYRKLKPLPRILLLVDEYQELFEDDRDGTASMQLLQLAQQGRSSGIHMLLGAQRFGVPGLLHQAAVMNSVHLRIAMQLPHDTVQALSEFGREGRHLIASCDLPGKVVINDRRGDDAGNVPGKVAYLDAETRNKLLELLQQMAKRMSQESLGRGVVCDGDLQPLFVDNPFIRKELRRSRRAIPAVREAIARDDIHKGGYGIDDWYSAEHPFALWLGQEFNVRGHASVIMRRRHADAAIMLGGSDSARYGMFAAALLSLGLAAEPRSIHIDILDRSMPNTPWYSLLGQVAELLRRYGFSTVLSRGGADGDKQIENAAEEVKRRLGMSEEELSDQPSFFLFISDTDRVRSLERQKGYYSEGSELGKKLQMVITEGPVLGVHVFLGFGSYLAMTQIFESKQLEHFRHRIVLQVSEDDSFNLVRSRKAAQLQANGKTPIAALYCDLTAGKERRFKPYAVEKADWPRQLQEISSAFQRFGVSNGNG
jgi:S-DNA-T family DNA segregation ATPase FtsK/SpoIIIE